MCVIHDTHLMCVSHIMGWLRLVGSLQLQVSFAKEPYKRDYILQKRPIKAHTSYVCVIHDTHRMCVSHITCALYLCTPIHYVRAHFTCALYIMCAVNLCISAYTTCARYDVRYGVATISRLLKIIGLFCRRAL